MKKKVRFRNFNRIFPLLFYKIYIFLRNQSDIVLFSTKEKFEIDWRIRKFIHSTYVFMWIYGEFYKWKPSPSTSPLTQ